MTNVPAVLQPSPTCQWFRLLTVSCQRFTNQPIVFCVVRPTLNSLALAKRAVSLFSSRAAALVSRVSRLRRYRARTLLLLNLKKKRDCSQSNQITDPGVTCLSEALKQSTCKLTTLNFNSNEVTYAGVASLSEVLKQSTCQLSAVSLGEAIKQSTCQLTTLYLQYNEITDSVALSLHGRLKQSKLK